VIEAATERREALRAALAEVQGRIDAARSAAARVDEVRLLVVTKTFPAADAILLAELGVTDVGENRDQEASAKRATADAAGAPLRWHMIGQVQRNKAPSVARWADVVESVDRLPLATALDRAAQAADRIVEVLLQVDLDPEPRPDRGGAAPAVLAALADGVAHLPHLRLRGVMAVAPHPAGPGGVAAAFERLQILSEQLRRDHPEATIISAGMSDDLEEAVAHGATQVRIGGAVLGHRAYVQ
jgi:pyridoxal phosphate enzyme (YggS family)